MRLIIPLLLAFNAYAQDPEAVEDAAPVTADDSPEAAVEGDLPAQAETGEAGGADTGLVDEAAEPEPEPEPEYVIRFRGQVTPDDKHFDLEELYAQRDFTAGLALAREQFAADPTDADLTWHIVRFMFEIAETFERDDPSIDKIGHYTEMLAIADQGLLLRPDDPHIRFARGIAAGRLGTTRGVLASLWSAKGIEADWLFTAKSGFEYAAINGNEQLPCDADIALGIFYRLVPDSWIVQMLAGTRGGLDKSLAHLEKANSCSPNRINVMKELGVTQLCIGSSKKDPAMLEKGKATVNAYRKLTPRSDKDRIDLRHGQALLDDPRIACGYSRDGQQDLDTAKLEKK